MNKTELINYENWRSTQLTLPDSTEDIVNEYLSFINSDANSESPSFNENEKAKEVCTLKYEITECERYKILNTCKSCPWLMQTD